MFTVRRKAVQSAGRIPTAARRGTSRYSTAEHGKTGHHAEGSSTEHGHHHAAPVEESLGVSTPFKGVGYNADQSIDCILCRPSSDPHIYWSLHFLENIRRRKGPRSIKID
jgi:hypothetical protein